MSKGKVCPKRKGREKRRGAKEDECPEPKTTDLDL